MYKISELLEKYPQVADIYGEEIEKESMFVMRSPFGNCQTFCLNNAKRVLDVKDEDMDEFMKTLFKYTDKFQCVIDVNSSLSEKILEKFKPFTSKVSSLKYESTNKSLMVIHLLQFDSHKLRGLLSD